MDNRFTFNPTSVNITRSRFQRNSTHKTTFNCGELVPIYLDEVLPGDTVSLDTAQVCRMSTPIYPVMDNAFMDVYYFFVPMRLVWDHSKEFFGENTDGPWYLTTSYQIPQLGVINSYDNSVVDHFGLPVPSLGSEPRVKYYVSALPFRAYTLIWNEWFRDQNVSPPIPIDKGDSTRTVTDTLEGWFTASVRPETHFLNTSLHCLPVGKFHDLFTSALREPQKGPDVMLPLAGEAPINSSTTQYPLDNAIHFGTSNSISPINSGFIDLFGAIGFEADGSYTNKGFTLYAGNSGIVNSAPSAMHVNSTNLYADLSQAAQVTINSLRYALALQGLYELDARGGTRYREIIKSHFGVTSPDARMQIPEYLHGRRIPVSMQQVLQTSATDSTSPQGNTAAYSLTQDRSNSFTYSATEHGYIIGLTCVRTQQSYQSRIERLWSRKDRFDFYWPVFANIGEQPILNQELYRSPNFVAPANDTAVFGFQEAWAEYRYKPSLITGKFRSDAVGTLDVWHYAEDFHITPTLSPEFIYQSDAPLQRTLAVQDEPQFIADFAFNSTWVRPMPMYSIPALLGRM